MHCWNWVGTPRGSRFRGCRSKGRNLPAYYDRGEQAIRQGDSEISEAWFNQAAEYWKQAIALTPGNYIEAQNCSVISPNLHAA